MSDVTLIRLWRAARWRRVLILLLGAAPLVVAATLLAHRFGGVGMAMVVAGPGALLLLVFALRRWRAVDAAWMVRGLDRACPALQDSSDLLLASGTPAGALQRLQQVRVRTLLAAQSGLDLREAVPRQTWSLALFGGVLACAALGWPVPAPRPAVQGASPAASTAPAAPSLAVALQITPPVYTGRAARSSAALDVEVEEGASIAWTLGVDPPPRAARLRFAEGDVLELALRDADWWGERRIDRDTLYRIELDGAAPLDTAAHRIQVIPDRAPALRVIAPERTLSVLDAAARTWDLSFEAEDDYGLGAAELSLTLAQGSGEQVQVSERRLRLRGDGDARRQRFAHRVDLAALGFARGDDLIARLELRDTRTPEPQVTRSASFILRWPAPRASEGSGVEGLVQQTLPAYFRSQRQIIIDTEALIAESAGLDADTLTRRSDAIGVDQRLLRLRYGQFLGEEAAEVAQLPVTASSPADGHDGHDEQDGHDEHDDAAAGSAHAHDHGAASAPAAFGDAGSLIAEVGHVHDIPEAATLLDPQTRRLLRAALQEMWQAEGQLRLGRPRAALPFEYRALDLIKRVQQADRIYLARVGLELPALDPARRLTGTPAAPGSRGDALQRAARDHDEATRAWDALVLGQAPDWEPLLAWVDVERDRIEAPLDLLAAIDALRRSPECRPCRDRLADQLWPLLPVTTAAPPRRAQADRSGAAYLDALRTTEPPP